MAQRAIDFSATTLTPTAAQGYIQQHMYPGQRPLSVAHVRYLASLMQTGHFRAGTILTFAYLKGDPTHSYCLNGQHTLHAIVMAQCPQEVILERREVSSMGQMATLYASYDRGRLRSMVDTYTGFATEGLERTHLSWLSGAIPNIVSGFDGLENDARFIQFSRNASLRYAWLLPWVPTMRQHLQCRKDGDRQVANMVSKRAAVLAVCLVTLYYQPTKATAFWTAVMQNTDLTAKSPAHTLIRWLYATPAVHLKPHIYARYVASAWNHAYRKTTVVTKLYARDSATPILLEGTPYTGKHTRRLYDTTGNPLPI